MRLIVGLGNPGRNYARTRHNAGAQCLEALAFFGGVRLAHKSALAAWAEATLEGQRVLLARPRTFVNNSGEAVAWLLARFSLSPSDLLVILDDMDLPLGRIRLRPKGSAGGHLGLGSVMEALGTREVPRLRVGIGRPPPGVDEVTYVLGAFTPPEEEVMQEVRQRVVEAVRCLLAQGLAEAMNRYN